MDWFLHDRDLFQERVNWKVNPLHEKAVTILGRQDLFQKGNSVWIYYKNLLVLAIEVSDLDYTTK